MVSLKVLGQSSLMSSWRLCFYALLLTVSFSEANYNLTVRFYEFRNPLGLQCGECESGGPPACCDDILQRENCTNTPPRTCDTRFRFELRPFGASVETARNGGFPHFTFSHGGNSDVFNEGSGGLLGLANPFTFTMTDAWPGRIQFFIDALDNDVSSSQLNEIEVIINRFLINLELQPGPNFTDRVNYTGFYNISELNFDISFRVQCLENYYGPNCTTFCEPVDGVYTCDSEGRFVCIEDNRDPTTTCSSCLPGYNPLQNCIACTLGRDISTNCVSCLPGFDSSTGCTTCLPGYLLTSVSQCTKDNASVTVAAPAQVGANLTAVSGVLGAIAVVLVILLIVSAVVVVVLLFFQARKKKQDKQPTTDATSLEAQIATADEHDVTNPLYGEGITPQANRVEEKLDLTESKAEEVSSDKVNLLETDGSGDTTVDEPLQSQPLEDATDSAMEANGADQEKRNLLSTVLEELSTEPSPSALAGGIYDIPPQESGAITETTSEQTSGVPVAEHEYAETEMNVQQSQPSESEQQSVATYTNTTPGVITQEAVNHYDMGQ